MFAQLPSVDAPTDEDDVTSAVGAPLAARELPLLFDRVHRELLERRAQIDDLNVFPVPDGDTGTNMVLTMRAGLDALHAARRDRRVRDVDLLARVVIRGVIRGARGNSGVILSQVVRAVVEVVAGHGAVDGALYAQALRHARDLAYEAVAIPVEGTILSAITAAANAADDAVQRGEDLVGVSAAACHATATAVTRTRDQLDVLTAAGVVDAGARGFEVLLAAVHRHLSGERMDVVVDMPRGAVPEVAGGCSGSLEHPYEVQYLLDAGDEAAGSLRTALEQVGDSVVVVSAGGLLTVHVHTATVGTALEAGMRHGVPSRVEIVDLVDQMRRGSGSASGLARNVGAVAVVSGDGMRTLLRESDVVVVDGRVAPSVDDLLGAVLTGGAPHTLLLPGDRGVVATAEQAARLAADQGHRVAVVTDADTPPGVLVATTVLDPFGKWDDVLGDVRAAVSGLATAEVVVAMRSGGTPVGHVQAGQYVVRRDGVPVGFGDDAVDAVGIACEALGAADAEVVTLLHGAQSTLEQRVGAAAIVARVAPYTQFEPVDAGVRPALFWVGVE